MTIKDFQKKYKHHISRGLSFDILCELKEIADLDFDVWLPSKNMNLQRGLVWTPEQKQALIFSILKDQKLNPFVVIQNKSGIAKKCQWEVIDGKQRINTIFEFFDNKFFITYEGKNYFFDDLPSDCQKQINLYDLWTVDVHYNYDNIITDETKISIFEDINFLGTPQDIAHLNKLKNGK